MLINRVAYVATVTLVAALGSASPVPPEKTSQVEAHNTEQGAVAYSKFESRCGVNALYLICRYHKFDLSYEDIVSLLPTTDLGVSMLSLKEAAEEIGFDVRALDIDPVAMTTFHSPLIVRGTFRNSKDGRGHFVVVLPDTSSDKPACWIFDPAKPWDKATRHEIKKPDSSANETIQVLVLQPRKKGSQPPSTEETSNNK